MYIEPSMVHLRSDFSKHCFSLCCFYIVALFLYLYCWHIWDFSGQCCTNNPNRISRSFSFIVVYLSFCCGKEMTDRAPDEPYSIICDPEVINRVGLTNRAGRSSLIRFVTRVRACDVGVGGCYAWSRNAGFTHVWDCQLRSTHVLHVVFGDRDHKDDLLCLSWLSFCACWCLGGGVIPVSHRPWA